MKSLLCTCALLVVAAPLATAAPRMNMAWYGCPAELTNPTDISDPCNDNDTVYPFYLSFRAPAGISRLASETFLVELVTEAPILPDWWHLELANATLGTPDGCRAGSCGFSTTRSLASTAVCKDYWGPNPQSGTTLWVPGINGDPGRSRLYGVFARSSASAGAVTADVDYYAGSGTIDTNHAVPAPGVDPCQGCSFGACLVWTYLQLQQPAGTPGGDFTFSAETVGDVGRYLTWQGARGVRPGVGCPAATPVRTATWGQVKSLYR